MQLPFFKNFHSFKWTVIVMLSVSLAGCVKDAPFTPTAGEENANVIHDWYKLIARIQLYTSPSPNVLQNFRNYGFIGVGLYESVQPGIKGGVSLSSKLYQMPDMPQADKDKHYLWSASANAALPSLIKQLMVGLTDANKGSIDSLENAYNERFRKHVPDEVIARSQAFGRSVADAIFQWSTTDKFNLSSTGYELPVCPSCWVLVPPAPAPVGPFLGESRPFLEYSVTAQAPPLPVPYSEDPSSGFYKEAKNVYDIGKGLTAEQKVIPPWWADAGGPGVGLAGGAHVFSIVTDILENKKIKLGKAAEIYAKASIALKDAPVIVWRSKYDPKFNLLRPVTYINRHIDAAWTTFLPTPPYPDYLSGLVSIYSSSMQILIREFGDIPITDKAYVWRGSGTREYDSLSDLVEEAGFSRVLAGIHYQFTQDVTISEARKLGNKIADLDLVRGHWDH
jgi:hypothetical protein